MAVIVDLFPVLPRRSYLSRPRYLDAERVKGPRCRSASVKANAPLDCLSGGALASRFHAWLGRSGRRYVCSVFPVDLDDPSAGLPELDGAVVIAVGFDRRRERFPIAIFEISAADAPLSFGRAARDAALAAGIREWHIHLLAESDAARRAVIFDLEETRHS
jgi:hypothetical protein